MSITAPSGYGKTITALLWEQADDRPFAWVQLDALDDDAVHLCQHIALALDHVEAIDSRALRALTGPGRSVDLDLLPALIRCLEDRPPNVLLLDDVHVLTSSASLHCIDALLRGTPPGGTLGLVGRSVDHLPLAKRRVTDDLLEVGVSDLAMSSREATELFRRAGLDVAADHVDELVERTEGWPAGLHLAELFMRSWGGDGATTAFTGRDRLVGDFLVQEVLSVTPTDVVEFLERSSVLDTMTGPLLDEVLERDDSARLLQSIERSGNLFLKPLDNDGVRFRYHHLFAELLRDRLEVSSPLLARELERRASVVLEAHGDIDRAVRHAARAGDEPRASDLILSHAAALTFHGRIERLAMWLDLLGEGAMTRSPSAAVAWAWLGVASGDGALAERALRAAARFDPATPLPDGSPSVRAAIAAVKAVAARDGVPGVLRDTEIVRAEGGPGENPWWVFATVVQGSAHSMVGEHGLARQRLEESLPFLDGVPMYEAGALAHLALLALYDDDLAEADRLATRSVRLVDLHNLECVVFALPVLAIGAVTCARCHRFDEARVLGARAEDALKRIGGLSPRSVVFAKVLLARVSLILGDRAAARALVADGQRARRRDPSAGFLNDLLDELEVILVSGEGAPTQEVQSLTAAELRLLVYLPSNLSLHDIALELNISRNTAKSHSVAIYRKLGVSSRGDAVTSARRIGLLT